MAFVKFKVKNSGVFTHPAINVDPRFVLVPWTRPFFTALNVIDHQHTKTGSGDSGRYSMAL